MKKVSVIIPTYKRSKYLKRAIESVLNQTYQNIEIIIVDDNDENSEYRKETEQKMELYKDNKNILYLKHKKNMNGAVARNTGIKAATGDYITFLDDDDFFLPNRIESLVKLLEENKEYNAIYSSAIKMYKNLPIVVVLAEKKGNLQYDVLCRNSFFCTGSNLFFRAKSLRKIGGFDESFYRIQDLEIMVRFFRNNEILNDPTYSVIKKEEDKINSQSIDRAINIRKYYLDTFEKDICIYKKDQINEIYKKNVIDMLKIAKINRSKIHYTNIYENYKINLTLLEKIKINLSPIYNNIIFIRIKYFIRGIINCRKIDKKIRKEIDYLNKIK